MIRSFAKVSVRVPRALPKALVGRYLMTRTWLLSWPLGLIFPTQFEQGSWRWPRDWNNSTGAAETLVRSVEPHPPIVEALDRGDGRRPAD
jgi:hypothetical protein